MARLDGQIGDQKFEDEGQPLAGGKLTFYQTGTSTLAPTYSDLSETIENPNPVILTATGRVPDVFYTGLRRVVLTDADDVFIQEWDPVGEQTRLGIKEVAATSYTISASDENTIIRFSSSSPVTVTVPADATEDLPIVFTCHVHRGGTGSVTVQGEAGVDVNSSRSLILGAQYSALSLMKLASDDWVAVGDQQ